MVLAALLSPWLCVLCLSLSCVCCNSLFSPRERNIQIIFHQNGVLIQKKNIALTLGSGDKATLTLRYVELEKAGGAGEKEGDLKKIFSRGNLETNTAMTVEQTTSQQNLKVKSCRKGCYHWITRFQGFSLTTRATYKSNTCYEDRRTRTKMPLVQGSSYYGGKVMSSCSSVHFQAAVAWTTVPIGGCLCSLLVCPALPGYAKHLPALSQYLGKAFELKGGVDTAAEPTSGETQIWTWRFPFSSIIVGHCITWMGSGPQIPRHLQ